MLFHHAFNAENRLLPAEKQRGHKNNPTKSEMVSMLAERWTAESVGASVEQTRFFTVALPTTPIPLPIASDCSDEQLGGLLLDIDATHELANTGL